MKIALCFFGITRSLKYTIKSINERIINILNKNNVEYDIFLHTYYLKNYNNIRTRESKSDIDNDEYKLLKAKYVQIDNQDKIKKEINMEQYRTHKDPWNTNYNSVDNFILAQYSKLQIVKMIEKSDNSYDYIIYLRPDVLYISDINLNFFNKITDHVICIPDFHCFKNNFNDRFAITNKETYKIYGEIFNDLLEVSKKKELHSETIIGDKLQQQNISIYHIHFRFLRIRCDGRCEDHIFNNYYSEDVIKKKKNKLNFIST